MKINAGKSGFEPQMPNQRIDGSESDHPYFWRIASVVGIIALLGILKVEGTLSGFDSDSIETRVAREQELKEKFQGTILEPVIMRMLKTPLTTEEYMAKEKHKEKMSNQWNQKMREVASGKQPNSEASAAARE